MTTPTPPKPQSGGFTAASTKTQDAQAFADQLLGYAAALKRELYGYGDVNTVGRDAQALRQFFGDIHRCELQIAQAMGIDWSPQNST